MRQMIVVQIAQKKAREIDCHDLELSPNSIPCGWHNNFRLTETSIRKVLAVIEITEYLEVWKSVCICGNIFILVCCISGMADDSAQLYVISIFKGKKGKR